MARWKDGAGAPVNAGYAIERAAPTHIRFLPEIEREAAELFIGHGVPESVINEETSEAEFRQAERDGLLWVAVSELGVPVGFARVEILDGAADRWSPSLAVLVREEAERGLESERRVVMSFATGTPQK